jgi:hypothetical protein
VFLVRYGLVFYNCSEILKSYITGPSYGRNDFRDLLIRPFLTVKPGTRSQADSSFEGTTSLCEGRCSPI